MSLLSMFFSEEDRKLHQMLKDHPNPDMHVVGDGTVRLDPKKIRESAEYKAFSKKMKEFAETAS
ncbi:MAG TPA: hypothetical protein DDX13_00325 [Marinobacter adhaerens]|uniref:hypothetical protein n=1 Tax=Marinobacter sp. UBA2678 TaxID=1946815 RepID=UPI000E7DC381|nr:hypothetical protein [Marinobacter sp. UBA2678]MCP4061893.1 hypothetical protein [Gammaproteobacteria bacterium]HBF92088.1 hypothetical protein [Marinobacter adhaerens]